MTFICKATYRYEGVNYIVFLEFNLRDRGYDSVKFLRASDCCGRLIHYAAAWEDHASCTGCRRDVGLPEEEITATVLKGAKASSALWTHTADQLITWLGLSARNPLEAALVVETLVGLTVDLALELLTSLPSLVELEKGLQKTFVLYSGETKKQRLADMLVKRLGEARDRINAQAAEALASP